ncbi:MAG: RsmE family RNA methyltransferase [Candidatus Omnitrophota bacterium]
MALPRFFYSFSDGDKVVCLDDPDEFFHLASVLRLKSGDAVEIVNGRGCLAAATLREVSRSSAILDMGVVSVVPMKSFPVLTLACAVPKKAKFETIIEKCTELGVDRIVPLLTARTENDIRGEKAGNKLARYRKVVLNAAKQCRRLWFPEIMAPVGFPKALTMLSGSRKALCIPWLEGSRVPLSSVLTSFPDIDEIIFFIGPEGDFTPAEVAEAVRLGAVPVTLGENVLKVDTAAIAVVSWAVLTARPC